MNTYKLASESWVGEGGGRELKRGGGRGEKIITPLAGSGLLLASSVAHDN